MLARTARIFLMPNYPGAGSVHSLRARKTPARCQNFWAVALPARPLSRLPGRRDGAQGRKTPLTSLCQQLQLCHGLPQATVRRPQKGVPVRPRLRGRFGAREALGRGDKRRGGSSRTPNPELGKEAILGRTRTARGLGGACLPEGLQRKGERVALRTPRTRRSLGPPVRARGRRYIFSSGPPHSSTSASRGEDRRREVWGEVGGTSHASAASQRREEEGEILDNVTPSTPNRGPA